MRAIIQHNFKSGLGDTITAIYEFIYCCQKLKKLGYVVDLKINNTPIYFDKSEYFNFFNFDEFKIFDSIEFLDIPIHPYEFEGCTCIWTLSNANPGSHYWDLFIDEGDKDLIINQTVKIHPYGNTDFLDKIDVLKKELISDAVNLISKCGINGPFKSIYYRECPTEGEHKKSYYEKVINTTKDILLSNQNEQFFICSDSYNYKTFVKNLNMTNVFFIDIPYEDSVGLQDSYFNNRLLKSYDDILERTKYSFCEMIILGLGTELFHFSSFLRHSNFITFARMNNIKINFIM